MRGASTMIRLMTSAVAAVTLLIAGLAVLSPGPLRPGVVNAGGNATCGSGFAPTDFLSATGSSVPGSLFRTDPATGASTLIGPVVTSTGQPLSITGLAQQPSTTG